jgi:hypothetical protein
MEEKCWAHASAAASALGKNELLGIKVPQKSSGSRTALGVVHASRLL